MTLAFWVFTQLFLKRFFEPNYHITGHLRAFECSRFLLFTGPIILAVPVTRELHGIIIYYTVSAITCVAVHAHTHIVASDHVHTQCVTAVARSRLAWVV